MRIVVISDSHGHGSVIDKIIRREKPDIIFSITSGRNMRIRTIPCAELSPRLRRRTYLTRSAVEAVTMCHSPPKWWTTRW